MGVAVVTEAAEDTAGFSGGGHAGFSGGGHASGVSRGYSGAGISHGLAAAMARAITHPESRRDATAATAAMGKGTTHREARLEARFIGSSAQIAK